MKREISFYEFVGILIPGTTLSYGVFLVAKQFYQLAPIDFSKFGETVIFLVVSYATGHLIQAVGNIFETMIWWFYKGMPTLWLNKPNRFGRRLFEPELSTKIINELAEKFGSTTGDYGRLTYNHLFQLSKTSRIDIFNGNYSLFRGLSVSFLILAICLYFQTSWPFNALIFIPFILLTRRMIRFAKYYARELFITFYNL